MVNAYLHILKEGCTWRNLPTRYGRWRTVYMRWSHWAKNGVWEQVFKGLQDTDMLPSAPTAGTLDSNSVPVHKHAAGAPEKTAGKRSDGHASVDDEDLFGGGECSSCVVLRTFPRQPTRCAGGS